MSSLTAARLQVLAAAALWSLGGLFIKEIDAGANTITFYRCLFSAALLAPLVPGRRFPRAPDTAVAVGLFAALLGLYVSATKATTAANAIFLQYTAPLYVIALAPLVLRERGSRRDAATLAVGLAGIAVLFLGNRDAGDGEGLWLGAGSGFFYGLFLLWLRRLRYAHPFAITFANCLGVAAIFAFVPGVWDVSGRDAGLLVLMAVFQFALPYVLFSRGVRLVPGTEASLLALIEPALNPIWVAFFFGEEPSAATIIGGAVIVLGLAGRYALLRAPAAGRPPQPL